MQTPDDKQFEIYLKRFHPIAPKPIRTFTVADASRRWFTPAARIMALVAVLVAAIIIWHTRSSRVVVQDTVHNVTFVDRRAPLEPLTMRTANAWLATAPSFQSAIDDLAFRSSTNPIPHGKQSALAVLSREEPNYATLQ